MSLRRTMRKTRLKLLCCPGRSSSMLCCPVSPSRIGSTRQMRHLSDAPGHVEDRRGWVALRAEGSISAAVYMVFTNVVFTGEGMFEVPGALVDHSALGAATLSVVHAGSHLSLAFHYGTKRSTNLTRQLH
jgi:hypothetical protein